MRLRVVLVVRNAIESIAHLHANNTLHLLYLLVVLLFIISSSTTSEYSQSHLSTRVYYFFIELDLPREGHHGAYPWRNRSGDVSAENGQEHGAVDARDPDPDGNLLRHAIARVGRVLFALFGCVYFAKFADLVRDQVPAPFDLS